MMNTINRLMTLALGSGLSILLSPNLAYPVDINLRIPGNSYGICISVVDLLSHQPKLQPLTDFSESDLMIENAIDSHHYQDMSMSIDQRGSERHR